MLTPNSDIYDPEGAVKQFEDALLSKHKEAFLYYAIIDIFKTKDLEDIMNIVELAHKFSKDDVGIMTLKLGDTIMRSTDIEDHQEIAFELYLLSERSHQTEAMRKVGYMLEHGMGVEQDYESALNFYKEAADLGDLQAKELMEDLKRNIDSGYVIIDDD